MHDVESKAFRFTLAGSGLFASLIFLLASMYANYRYGYSFARSGQDGIIYGSAAAAGDILMAASPFFFFAALRNRETLRAIAAALVWAATTALAAQSAVSHASLNRFDA